MKYRDYAKMNNPAITEEEMENAVGGLFGVDAEMVLIEHGATFEKYNVGGYMFYSNHSTFDMVESVDEDGVVLESWELNR